MYECIFRLCNGIATSPRILEATLEWTQSPQVIWYDTIESGPLKEVPIHLNNCSHNQTRL